VNRRSFGLTSLLIPLVVGLKKRDPIDKAIDLPCQISVSDFLATRSLQTHGRLTLFPIDEEFTLLVAEKPIDFQCRNVFSVSEEDFSIVEQYVRENKTDMYAALNDQDSGCCRYWEENWHDKIVAKLMERYPTHKLKDFSESLCVFDNNPELILEL